MDGVPLHGGNKLPITGSHEAVGIIDKIGPDVDTTRFKIGDRVGTLNYYHPCGIHFYDWADCQGFARTARMMRRAMFIVNKSRRHWDLREMVDSQSTW
jgi:threonine dehydrogenase-like Zn-dependent dehydrogenase